MENGQITVEHVPDIEQKANILTKPLAKIKIRKIGGEFKKLISLTQVEIKRVNVR